jgi:hypothetical protein
MDTIEERINRLHPTADAKYRAHLRAGCEGWNAYVDAYPTIAAQPELARKYIIFHGGKVCGTYDDFCSAAEDVIRVVGTHDGVVITRVGDGEPVKI